MRDPYVVLGVPRSASAEELKGAYRRLAKRLHPDLNPGNRTMEQQFKEATAAYELLSDPVKRARFDRGELDADGSERMRGFRYAGAGAGAGARKGRSWADADGFSLDEVIAEFLGRNRRPGTGAGTEPPRARAADAAAASAPGQTLRLSFTEAAIGGRQRITLADSRAVEVTIPAGVETGQRLRLRGTSGDTYLDVEVEPHPFYTRKDRDIHVEIPVTLVEAVLGATITVPTIHGAVSVKVPPGSNSGSLLRLKGKGIAGAGKAAGDQYVKLKVVLPDPPDPELRGFLERWAHTHSYAVRGKLDAE